MKSTTTTGIEIDRFGNHRCCECQRFVSASEQERGRAIKHANHCDSKAQPATVTAPVVATPSRDAVLREHGRQGTISAVASDDEIVDAYRRGAISASAAMNRDY